MRKKERNKVKREMFLFKEQLLKNIKSSLRTLEKIEGISLDVYPKVFTNQFIDTLLVYSSRKKQVFIKFSISEKNNTNVSIQDNDVLDYYDPIDKWKHASCAFNINNSQVHIENLSMKGAKPFEASGSLSEIFFKNIHFQTPSGNNIVIDFAILLSYEKFKSILEHIDEYGINLVMALKNNINDNDHNKIHYLENLLEEMKYYFFSNSVSEAEIDNFIERNPLLLEYTLGLTQLKSQVILEDCSDRFKTSLRPDAIAYSINKKSWIIIDYKKSKSELLKKVGKSRTSFKADVRDLEAQLKDYIEYFDEKSNRDYYKEHYGDEVKYPNALGIIGILNSDYINDFNRLQRDLPKWFDLEPYNFIYEKFSKFINTVKAIK